MNNIDKFASGEIAYFFNSREDWLNFVDIIFSRKNTKPSQSRAAWLDNAPNFKETVAFKSGSGFYTASKPYVTKNYGHELVLFTNIANSSVLIQKSQFVSNCRYEDGFVTLDMKNGSCFKISIDEYVLLDGEYVHKNIGNFNFEIKRQEVIL